MASYLSKVPDFGTYQPEVNAELYGKLLVKKQSDYEAGLEKAQKDIDYIASLPVARETDRSYLQEIINSVTSEINEGAFTDWSNLSVQKLTKKHITRLANDSNIQNAVSSASVFKTGHNLAKTSQEQNEGKDAANQYNWQQQLSPWLNSTTPGEKFNGRFNSFVDINAERNKIAEEVPIEEWTISDPRGLSSPLQYTDIVNQSFKARRPEKIRQALTGYIDTNPATKSQLRLEALYNYKDYGKEDLVQELYRNKLVNLSHYGDEAETIYEQLNKLGDQSNPLVVKKRKELEKQLDVLAERVKTESLAILENSDKEVSARWDDENQRNSLLYDMYKDKWVQQAVTNYGFNNPQGTTISGQTAFQKQIASETRDIARSQYELALKKAIADQTDNESFKMGPLVPPGISTEAAGSSYAKAMQVVDDKDSEIAQLAKNVAFNITSKNGGWGVLKKDYDGKNIYISKAYVKTNIPGIGVREVPSDIYIAGGDFIEKFRDEKGNLVETKNSKKIHYDGFIPQIVASYRKGEYKNTGKLNNFIIGDEDIADIELISQKMYAQSDKKDLISGLQNEVYERTGVKDLVERLNISPELGITGKDVIKFNNLPTDLLQSYTNAYERGVFDPKDRSEYQMKMEERQRVSDLLDQYGLDVAKLSTIKNRPTPLVTQLKNKSIEAAHEINRAFETKNIIVSPVTREWTGDKDPADKLSREDVQSQRARSVQTLANMYKESTAQNSELVGQAKKILDIYRASEKSKEYPVLSYTQKPEGKGFFLTVSKGTDRAELPISDEQAQQWGWDQTIGEVTDLEQTIRWNRYSSTVPFNPNNNMPYVQSFENARHLGVIGNTELRYHVIPRTTPSGENEYTAYFYTKNVSSDEDPSMDMQYVPNNDLNAFGKMIQAKKEEIIKKNKQNQLNKRK
jgi:hypothetical protein